MNQRGQKALFKRTALRTRKANLAGMSMRGGTRL